MSVSIEDFEYIINRPPVGKVAFGTTMDREVLPVKGKFLTSFMRRNIGEVRNHPAPGTYNPKLPLRNPFPSTKGWSVFLRLNLRFAEEKPSPYPSIGYYDVEKVVEIKPPRNPFNCPHEDKKDAYFPKGSRAFEVGHYQIENPIKKPMIRTHFRTCREIRPAIITVCKTKNKAKCYICDTTPVGDYFCDFDQKLDVCRKCMKKKVEETKSCLLDFKERWIMQGDLERFKQCRYCDIIHNHNNTKASIKLMTKREWERKIRIENYLYPYMINTPIQYREPQ
ncbi:uncharacterized protein LOC119687939 [Teleopsis dalmanni]|uniref:uncharacterized protein LOC119687939 n=1 Tax=Teleopsis dalmanni TaxID=139649 RepID=UPI0018CD0C24|nr:uncharacterized protein LOC119687939 [Teleopsis dalmanni]